MLSQSSTNDEVQVAKRSLQRSPACLKVALPVKPATLALCPKLGPRQPMAELFGPIAQPSDDARADAALGAPKVNAEIRLRLIATSDLHACLMGYDYYANQPVNGQGLSQIAHQIASARAEAPNSLLFDNGDFLQGNPLGDYVATAKRRRRAHPVITAFNTLGYDAATLGNHEFNFGLPFLQGALAKAQFPFVSANIVTRFGKSPARDTTFVPPYTILNRTVIDSRGRPRRLRIGVIGFAPPQIEIWDREHLNGKVRVRDILAAARAWLPRLKARGVDVIVALAHSGIGSPDAEYGMENAAAALAALPEIDAVIAGHSHLAFPGPGIPASPGIDPVRGLLSGKPAVMPGHSGSHIGVIDLLLTPLPLGRRGWSVSTEGVRLSPASAQRSLESNLVRGAIAPDHRATLAWSRRPIGKARVPLHTHFATLVPNAAMTLIAEAKLAYVQRAISGTQWADLPLLAGAAPFRSGGRGGPTNFTDIPAGLLRMRSLSDLYLFPNSLVTLALTGADLADWLEQSVSLFNQIMPGANDAVLHDPLVPFFSFDMPSGVSFAIDLSQPARFDARGHLVNAHARRIVGLSRNGCLLDADERLLLVTNGHRASRAIALAPAKPPVVAFADGARVQCVLQNHIRSHVSVGAQQLRHWRFLPMPGTTVTVGVGAGAARHLSDIACYRPELIGQRPDGFTHYRLHL